MGLWRNWQRARMAKVFEKRFSFLREATGSNPVGSIKIRNLIMSFYIIVRGPLGCGKSTIAEKIAKIIKAEYVPIDRVLDENNLTKERDILSCLPKPDKPI